MKRIFYSFNPLLTETGIALNVLIPLDGCVYKIHNESDLKLPESSPYWLKMNFSFFDILTHSEL